MDKIKDGKKINSLLLPICMGGYTLFGMPSYYPGDSILHLQIFLSDEIYYDVRKFSNNEHSMRKLFFDEDSSFKGYLEKTGILEVSNKDESGNISYNSVKKLISEKISDEITKDFVINSFIDEIKLVDEYFDNSNLEGICFHGSYFNENKEISKNANDIDIAIKYKEKLIQKKDFNLFNYFLI